MPGVSVSMTSTWDRRRCELRPARLPLTAAPRRALCCQTDGARRTFRLGLGGGFKTLCPTHSVRIDDFASVSRGTLRRSVTRSPLILRHLATFAAQQLPRCRTYHRDVAAVAGPMAPPLDVHDQEGQPLEFDQQTGEEVVRLGGADDRPRMLPVGRRARPGSARDALPGSLFSKALPNMPAVTLNVDGARLTLLCLSARTLHAHDCAATRMVRRPAAVCAAAPASACNHALRNHKSYCNSNPECERGHLRACQYGAYIEQSRQPCGGTHTTCMVHCTASLRAMPHLPSNTQQDVNATPVHWKCVHLSVCAVQCSATQLCSQDPEGATRGSTGASALGKARRKAWACGALTRRLILILTAAPTVTPPLFAPQGALPPPRLRAAFIYMMGPGSAASLAQSLGLLHVNHRRWHPYKVLVFAPQDVRPGDLAELRARAVLARAMEPV